MNSVTIFEKTDNMVLCSAVMIDSNGNPFIADERECVSIDLLDTDGVLHIPVAYIMHKSVVYEKVDDDTTLYSEEIKGYSGLEKEFKLLLMKAIEIQTVK